MQQHPFLQNTAGSNNSFPPQMVSKQEKETNEWKESMMNALESIGKLQYFDNLSLDENVRMCNGEFLTHQYEDVEENEYVDLLHQIQKDFKTPKRLRHFDFLNQILETFLGEFDNNPDTFRIVAKGEEISNQREREKSKMLLDFIVQEINTDINNQLKQQGFDINKSDFQNQEEQTEYQQQVEQAKQALTPIEIQSYFDNKWSHVAEKWANIQHDNDKERYNLKILERNEFKNFLSVGKCWRHYFLTATGYNQESWDYKQVFYQKSENILYPEKGNYIGRTSFMSLSDIIDKYGFILTGEELENLKEIKKSNVSISTPKDFFGNSINYLSPNGLPYGVKLPTNNPDLLNLLPQVSNTSNMLSVNPLFKTGLDYSKYLNNLYQVTEAYWISQKKIGRLYWYNPTTETEEYIIVDENFVKPKDVKEVKGTLLNQSQELNTWETTWINCVYQGKKITPLNTQSNVKNTLYFDIKEADYQGKGDANIYDCSFPVIGLIEQNPLINKIKSFQIAHNMFLNQAYLIAEEEILPFLMIDVNTIPKLHDWGGGMEGFAKYMESIKSLRTGLMDTRPHITNGANAGGQLPLVVDLDSTRRLESRIQLAETMKQLGLAQIGFNNQRLGSIKPYETATGVQQATQGSYTQSSSIFTYFYDYLKRTYKKNLDFAQFVQSKNLDIKVSYTKSDQSKAWLQLNGTELSLVDLQVYVLNTQDEVRKLELVRKLGIENNTIMTKMSDRIVMATSDSIHAITEIIKLSEKNQEEREKQVQELEQQKMQQAQELQKSQQDYLSKEKELDRQAKHEDVYMQTFGYQQDNLTDTNNSGEFDILEYNKLSQRSGNDNSKIELQRNKQDIDRLKMQSDLKKHDDKMLQGNEKMQNQLELEKLKIKQAQILGDKSK